MNSGFETAMHRAPPILFVMALLLLATGFAYTLLAFQGIDTRTMPFGNFGTGTKILVSLAQALQISALPFFGAAVLWRLDKLRVLRAGATVVAP